MSDRLQIAALVAMLAICSYTMVNEMKEDDPQELYFTDPPHFMADWSTPPPWPVFMGANFVAKQLRNLADKITPPPIRMMDHAFAYQRSNLAYLMLRMGIPEILEKGPQNLRTIKDNIGMGISEENKLERVLYALAAHDLIRIIPVPLDVLRERNAGANLVFAPTDDQPASTRLWNHYSDVEDDTEVWFGLTETSSTLRADHPNSMAGMLGHQVEDAQPVWSKLWPHFHHVSKKREAVPYPSAWELAFPGFPYRKGGIWKFFQQKKDREEQFGRAMAGLESIGGQAIAMDGPFQGCKRIIDIGGSLGHLLHTLLHLHPNATGVLFDRAAVIENARTAWVKKVQAPWSIRYVNPKRVKFVKGDFLKSQAELNSGIKANEEGGDCYVLRYIIHDWNPAEATKIMEFVRSHIGNNTKGTRIMLGESAMPDRPHVHPEPVVHNVDVLMMGLFGYAKERTPLEWNQLLNETGFSMTGITPTRSLVHWVEAVPV